MQQTWRGFLELMEILVVEYMRGEARCRARNHRKKARRNACGVHGAGRLVREGSEDMHLARHRASVEEKVAR